MRVACLRSLRSLRAHSLSQLQLDMYHKFLSSKIAKEVNNGGRKTLVLRAQLDTSSPDFPWFHVAGE